jgi:hypothetical protein
MERIVEYIFSRPALQRIVLAFTVGMFLACGASASLPR